MEQVYCGPRLMTYPERRMLAVYPRAAPWLRMGNANGLLGPSLRELPNISRWRPRSRASDAKGLLHYLSAWHNWGERPTGLRVVVLQRYTFNRLSTAEVAHVVHWRLAAQP